VSPPASVAPSASAAAGTARLRLALERRRDGVTRLASSFAQAPLRAHRAFAAPDGTAVVTLVHVGPGLLAGDRLEIEVHVGPGASAILLAQSATKVHTMPLGASAGQSFHARVEAGGRLEVHGGLVVPFPGAELAQETSIDLAGDASVVWTERWCLGRHRRGERATFRRLTSQLRIRRDGRLDYADRLLLDARPEAPVGPSALGVLGGYDALASGVALAPAPLQGPPPSHEASGVFADGASAYLRCLDHDPGPLRDVVFGFADDVRAGQGLRPVDRPRYGA
jgi:urease accessory protein